MQRDEKMLINIDPKTGVLNYQESSHKRWF